VISLWYGSGIPVAAGARFITVTDSHWYLSLRLPFDGQ
jgi:hypothetical protein